MTVKVRDERPDEILEQFVEALRKYDEANPGAQIDAYRQNSASVRVRILNPKFAGMSRVEREDDVYHYLDTLSDDTLSEMSVLILLTPEEAPESFANYDFENPLPFRL